MEGRTDDVPLLLRVELQASSQGREGGHTGEPVGFLDHNFEGYTPGHS